ncbi:MAG: diguanylate cyclase [Erythrobacter sp.]
MALAAIALASPASAHGDQQSFSTHCHATSGLSVGFTEMIAADAPWACSDDNWRADQPVAWLRFDAEQWADAQAPQYFFTRIARHKSITFGAVSDNGTVRTVEWAEADGKVFGAGPLFQLDLPEITEDTRAVIVRIERPHSLPLLTEAQLTSDPTVSSWSMMDVILLAIVVGMLILPLFFDISFFIVLREKFVLLHALMVVSMISYVLFAGGLIGVFVQLPVAVISIIGALGWAIGVGVSALFLVTFLEDGAQSRWMQRITIATGLWTICVPGFFALQLHSTQAFDDRGYFYAFLPVIAVFTAALIEALMRGSRSARFVALAWAPIIAASVERLLRGLGVYTGPSSLDQLIFFATGLEVVLISLGVADRFFDLRRQRDEAVTEAQMLERLTERDPLTGLMNRRGLDARFEDLHRAGYETIGLIDLDLFKSVNDTAGHATGDKVLQVVADVLDGDKDCMAIRMGGEEFLLMLRGKDADTHAEKLRNSLPLRVAQEVPELESLVTGSMGLLTVPHRALPNADFAALYTRADKLLYEAKNQGRNRTVSERLRAFTPRSEDRRKGAGKGKGRRRRDKSGNKAA